LGGNTNVIDLHDVRLRHAYYGFYGSSSTQLTLRNAQILRNFTAFGGCAVRMQNVLIQDGVYAVGGSQLFEGQHVTFHRTSNFRSAPSYTGATLTNCLIISVTNYVLFSGANVVTNHNDAGVFQTVGGGGHYLAESSSHRNSGTTNINADLLADLRKKTTYPPVVLSSNTISVNTTLSPQAQRDTDTPDLGYHYDPLDYLVRYCGITNATVTLTNGVAVGTVGWPGFILWPASHIVSEGSPVSRNHVARYDTVQEDTLNWDSNPPASAASITALPNLGPLSTGKFRFTDFDILSGGGYHFLTSDGFRFAKLSITDCEFNSGKAYLQGGEDSAIGLTNNLFHRVDNYFLYSPQIDAYNNLFKGGICVLERYFWDSTNNWIFKDNSFDAVTLADELGGITHGYNAYISGTPQLDTNTLTDKVLTSLSYETGPLGKFYQLSSSALTNAGSRLASAATLYHHTLHTNQTKETSSQVDIGYHYVALNGENQPVDSDTDGVPDYLEDANGNGNVDSGETDPNSSGDYGLGVRITRPKSGAVIP
jgi:hypothetical protein